MLLLDKSDHLSLSCAAMGVPALYKRLGATMKARRHQLGLTQSELARELGISRASLASIETGRQGVSVHRLYVFAEKLGVEAKALLPGRREAAELRALDGLAFSEEVSLADRRKIARLVQESRSP